MIIHFKGCNQIPGSILPEDDTKFTLPKYPESTTDPTYYEPTATRIANMKRSAGAFQGLYDFAGSAKSKEDALSQLDNASVDIRFSKHGMTKEEISQITMEKSLEADSLISKKKQDKRDKTEALKNEIETAEAVSKALEKVEVASGENTIQKTE